jgi:hypothetical protein
LFTRVEIGQIISVEAFTRRVGTVYPQPTKVSGRGRLWLREDLDTAIERMAAKQLTSHDLAREFGAS